MRNGTCTNQDPFKRASAITLSNSTTYVDSVGSGATQAGVQQSLECFDAFQVTTTAGTINVKDMAGNVTAIYCALGQIIFMKVQQFQTGGTAAGLVGFYY